jgi:F-box and leucine-rich repeat protein 14
MHRLQRRRASVLQQLRHLTLHSAANVTDDGLQHLSALSAPLRAIEIDSCTRISDRGAAQLAALRHVSHLHLGGCVKLSNVSLSFLTTALYQLQSLHLEHCWQITDEGILDMAWATPQLSSMSFKGWRHVSSDGVSRTLCALGELRRLTFANCMWLNDTCLKEVALQQRLLTYIDLQCCSRVTDSSLQLLIPLLALEVLILDGCPHITDVGMTHVAALKRLRRLSVGGSRVSDAGLVHLGQLVHLTYLNVWGCRVTNDSVQALRTNHVHVHK